MGIVRQTQTLAYAHVHAHVQAHKCICAHSSICLRFRYWCTDHGIADILCQRQTRRSIYLRLTHFAHLAQARASLKKRLLCLQPEDLSDHLCSDTLWLNKPIGIEGLPHCFDCHSHVGTQGAGSELEGQAILPDGMQHNLDVRTQEFRSKLKGHSILLDCLQNNVKVSLVVLKSMLEQKAICCDDTSPMLNQGADRNVHEHLCIQPSVTSRMIIYLVKAVDQIQMPRVMFPQEAKLSQSLLFHIFGCGRRMKKEHSSDLPR